MGKHAKKVAKKKQAKVAHGGHTREEMERAC
jgi:hypothetical protein